tara:strand:+ start:2722 stop:2967 length:246 start_codon:yes stop_codon:yes gene_type:complete
MTEENIIELKFEKQYVGEEICDVPFHYYSYRIGNIDLITNDNIESKNGGLWYAEILEGNVRFYNFKELKIVIELMELNKIF